MNSTDLAYSFVQRFNEVILFPTITLLSAIALLVFMYGCFLYIVRAGDPAARAQGVKHITWGIVGVVVMLSAYTIMSIAAGTFGLEDTLNCANDPNGSGCVDVLAPPGNPSPITPVGNPVNPGPITPPGNQNNPGQITPPGR